MQPGLFDEPDEPPVAAPRNKGRDAAGPVHYETYGGPKQCNDCEQLVYEQLREAGASTHLIRQARVKRSTNAGKTLLCNPHAHLRQDAEAAGEQRK